jgi:hypothetical protein
MGHLPSYTLQLFCYKEVNIDLVAGCISLHCMLWAFANGVALLSLNIR